MDNLLLIVRMAGERVALLAEGVESVVEIATVTPVPLASPHVAGLAALRSRVMTVIDTRAALDLGTAELADAIEVVTIACDGHLYGLMVEAVEDVVEMTGGIRALRSPLAGGWARATRGLVEVAGDALLLIDPIALVTEPHAIAA